MEGYVAQSGYPRDFTPTVSVSVAEMAAVGVRSGAVHVLAHWSTVGLNGGSKWEVRAGEAVHCENVMPSKGCGRNLLMRKHVLTLAIRIYR